MLCLAATLLAGCGSDDSDEGDRADTGPAPAGLAHFESPGSTSPSITRRTSRPRDGHASACWPAWESSAAHASTRSRYAARPAASSTPIATSTSSSATSSAPWARVDKRKERIGDLDAGVLEFEDSVKRGPRTVDFKSASYFFRGAGQTWQVECIADDEHLQEIEAACRIALGSVAFGG